MMMDAHLFKVGERVLWGLNREPATVIGHGPHPLNDHTLVEIRFDDDGTEILTYAENLRMP